MKTLFFLGTLCFGVLCGGYVMREVVPPAKEYVEKVVQVAKPEPSIPQIIDRVSKHYGIPKILLLAVIKTESAGDSAAIRHEPSYLSKVPKAVVNPDQRKMWASSVGLMQVMAYPHAYKRGLHWADLLEPERNITVGAEILFDCEQRHKNLHDPVERIKAALGCYNGDKEIYPQLVMRNVGEMALRQEENREVRK